MTWEFDIPPDLVIEADGDQLRSIFVNLLLNAAQSMPGGGLVSVDVVTADGACIVGVRDRGPGIPREWRERVFEPFYSTKARGSGLGLPTAKRIAEAHGGAISLTDAPGGGTIATVTLPLRRPAG